MYMIDIFIMFYLVIFFIILFTYFYKFLLMILMLIEFIIILIIYIIYIYMSMYCQGFMVLFYMVYCVCESVIGLTLIVYIVRYYSSDMVKFLNMSSMF